MTLKIYLIRHGETEWTLSKQHTGLSDIPLTANGEKQALGLKKRLASIHWKKVISSPLQRAHKTCELAGLGADAILDARAVEWDYGDYEGLTTTAIHQKKPHWNLFADGAPGGESVGQVGRRADEILMSLKGEAGPVAIFSHGHFLRILAARWLGLEPENGKLFSLSVASVSLLTFERQQPVVALWNEQAID
jgi:probable phosphoglycerate mutase